MPRVAKARRHRRLLSFGVYFHFGKIPDLAFEKSDNLQRGSFSTEILSYADLNSTAIGPQLVQSR